jgi:hypothetical protein
MEMVVEGVSGMAENDGKRRTHIRIVYTLNTDRSEDLLNPIFGPFHLLPIDRD